MTDFVRCENCIGDVRKVCEDAFKRVSLLERDFETESIDDLEGGQEPTDVLDENATTFIFTRTVLRGVLVNLDCTLSYSSVDSNITNLKGNNG